MFGSTSLAALALGSALVAASPVSNLICTKPWENVDANFDDITAIPGNALGPVPTSYKGLDFSAFSVVDVAEIPDIPKLKPHSGSKYIAAATVTKLLSGTAKITTDFPENKATNFDLHSLYYGCAVALGQAEAAIPIECNIDVTGFKGADNSGSNEEVCHQRLHYKPASLLAEADMAKADFGKKCEGVTYVELTYSLLGPLAIVDDLAGIGIDNVDYTLHYCKQ